MRLFIRLRNIFKSKFQLISTIIFSIIFALFFVLGKKITFNNSVFGKITDNYIVKFRTVDIFEVFLISVIMFFSIYFILNLISKIKFSEKSKSKNSSRTFAIFSVIIFLCWLPNLLANYPGCVLPDSLSEIWQALGACEITNHHPILYTILIKLFITFGKVFSFSINKSIFCVIIFQSLLMAGSIAYTLNWLISKGVNFLYVVFWLFFYALVPCYVIYAFNLQKDTLFSTACLLIIPLLYDIVESQGKKLNEKGTLIYFFINSFFIIFMRNNGILVVVGIMFFLCISYFKKIKKFLIESLIFILCVLIIQGPIYSIFRVGQTEFAESIGLPLQQVYRVLAYDGDVNKEQKIFLNNILPSEDIKSIYTPCIVDTIKGNKDFNANYLSENKAKFFKIYLQLFVQNPKIYLDAFLLNTYGFWSIGTKNFYGFMDTRVHTNDLNITRVNFIKEWFGIDISGITKNADFFGSGTLDWIMLVSMFLVFVRKKFKELIPYLPCFIVWISILVATPVAFSLRYVFVLALSLHLIIIIPIIINKRIEDRR